MMGTKTVKPKRYLNFSLDATVPRNHLVRRLAAAVDFRFVHGLVGKYYSHTGQPSVDPVVIFKLSLLVYLFNISSERRLCEEAGLNLAWRWFLGYELDEAIPDHSVLSKARRRFGVAVYERFFRRVVKLCEAPGLVEGDVLFLDSTMTKANASPQSMCSRKLLEQVLPQPERFISDLWVVNDEADTEPPPRPKKPRSGRPVNPEAPYLQSRSVTNELRVSTTDPDAQMFQKLGRTPILAHKTQMVVDGGKAAMITAVEERPACEADSHAWVGCWTSTGPQCNGRLASWLAIPATARRRRSKPASGETFSRRFGFDHWATATEAQPRPVQLHPRTRRLSLPRGQGIEPLHRQLPAAAGDLQAATRNLSGLSLEGAMCARSW